MRHRQLGKLLDRLTRLRCLVCGLLRDSVQFCSGLVDLVVGVRHHPGGGHRLALAGERFVGLVVEDIAQVGDHIAARRVAAGWAIPVTEKVTRRKRGGGRAGSF